MAKFEVGDRVIITEGDFKGDRGVITDKNFIGDGALAYRDAFGNLVSQTKRDEGSRR